MTALVCSLLQGYLLHDNLKLRGQMRSLERNARARNHVITDLFDCVVDYADHSSGIGGVAGCAVAAVLVCGSRCVVTWSRLFQS